MSVDIASRSMRLSRLTARAPRLILLSAACVLSAAGLRSVVASTPPRLANGSQASATAQLDLGAEAFAEAFARSFLSWDSTAPADRSSALRGFSVEAADASEGLKLRGHQSVLWTAIAGDELAPDGRHLTVRVETSHGPVGLAMTVSRGAHGQFKLEGPPAVVGLPPADADVSDEPRDPLDDLAVESTVIRALRNFLAGRRDALSADLAPGAQVLVPAARFDISSPVDLSWVKRGAVVRVAVKAGLEGDRSELALGYRIGVLRRAGRWFVSWIDDNRPLESEDQR